MEKRKLGQTDIEVTTVCLGTMTWGEQNTEAEAHEQLDYAIDRGINFIDAAEMYPVPGDPKTQGRTEEYIGNWIEARKNRDQYILATKVAGRSAMKWTRDSATQTRHTPAQIDEAVEKSLKRLKTDYIDLYQLHWPDRDIAGFGFHSYRDYDTEEMVALEDILGALHRHVEKGNIRHVGLSNEYGWATMKFLEIADRNGWPRMVSNQCVYSLISRRFDYERAEIAMREGVGLLAYSPLAMGLLTGKYDDGKTPKGSRKDLFPDFLGRYSAAQDAIIDCNDTARKLGLTPTEFALKFVETRVFLTSNIIGATTMEQLEENINAHEIVWTDEMEKEAARIHETYRSPVA
ncbi:aldo/keto reductase [Litorimonas sp. RW-G-Af-16]|uniref:aldo/keto reductase n=1 Tax=Litorimonas sp. RW-G-Af-16 TaxID=3241168 RepID=UPI00390C847C